MITGRRRRRRDNGRLGVLALVAVRWRRRYAAKPRRDGQATEMSDDDA